LLRRRQFFAEPSHGAVEVLQLQALGTGDDVAAFPGQGGAITAGIAEAVQDTEEDGAFDGELETAVVEELLDDRLTAGVAPEAFEDQGRSQARGADDRGLAVVVGGQKQDVFGEAGAGGEEGVEVARQLQLVKTSEGDENSLADAALGTGVLDDLQVAAWSRGFDAEEHGALE
jgi:hypothetical protein